MRILQKPVIYRILIALFALATVWVLVSAVRNPPEQVISMPPAATEPALPPSEKTAGDKKGMFEKAITAEIIQSGLRDMGFLVTGEYYFTEVSHFTSTRKLFEMNMPLTESGYLIGYDGTVTAGIDFSDISVKMEDGRITVVLPEARIQGVTIDPDSFVKYSEKASILNPLSVEDFNSSLTKLETTARNNAIERGLLERAGENAKTVISNFIGSLAGSCTVEYETI